MKKYISLSFARPDSNLTVEVGDNAPFRLISVSGLESSEYDIPLSPDACSDIAHVSGFRVAPRKISVVAESTDILNSDTVREKTLRFFSPKVAGTLYVTVTGTKRKISYFVTGFKFLQDDISAPVIFSLSLICPDPYFKDADGFAENIAAIIPFISFPTRLVEDGIPASYKKFSDRVTLFNGGDIPVGLTVTFRASGAVSAPRIDNLTTGKFICVNTTLSNGDELIISTVPTRKRVTLNGENISNLLDRSSSFFPLEQGKNVISYSALSGRESLCVYPLWEGAYLGI